MNEVIDLLKSHRSIRKFTEQKIPQETFLELIRAGQSAATSNHVQAYSIIHVTSPEKRAKIAELAGGQKYVETCSHFLVFCADMKRPTDSAERAGAEQRYQAAARNAAAQYASRDAIIRAADASIDVLQVKIAAVEDEVEAQLITYESGVGGYAPIIDGEIAILKLRAEIEAETARKAAAIARLNALLVTQ